MDRESLIQEVSKFQREITDLRDMLQDDPPARIFTKITNRIKQLEDMIFNNNELLDQMRGSC